MTPDPALIKAVAESNGITEAEATDRFRRGRYQIAEWGSEEPFMLHDQLLWAFNEYGNIDAPMFLSILKHEGIQLNAEELTELVCTISQRVVAMIRPRMESGKWIRTTWNGRMMKDAPAPPRYEDN